MKSLGIKILALLLLSAGCSVASAQSGSAIEQTKPKKKLSDAQIRKILVQESIASSSGNCPCPYNRAKNGSKCGKRSAHSRSGGAEVLCYPKDVSQEMVEEYREAHVDT